jgi:peptidoglycan hydrolase-like protein with peptidoglycan-binding domain
MAQSGITAIGVQLETVPDQDIAWVQGTLIRLGFDPGRIDGVQGDRTNNALKDAGVDVQDPVTGLSNLLQSMFPLEYPKAAGTTGS